MEPKNWKEAEELGVSTPLGYLEAIDNCSPDYPGVSIHLNGILVAMVEYDSLKKVIRTIAYNSVQDEPISITNY